MAVLTLEKSRFKSVQLDITDVIVKKKNLRKNTSVHIYTHTYITGKRKFTDENQKRNFQEV